MDILNYIILGVVQGITEFLPISSSGHVAIAENLLGFKISLEQELILNIASLIALLYFMRGTIKELLLEFVAKDKQDPKVYSKLGIFRFPKKLVMIVLSIIPVSVVAIILKDYIETKSQSLSLVAFMMILIGIYLIIAEKLGKKNLDENNLTNKDALILGIAQALALIRGVSRSGITIATGLLLGYTRESAIKLSFLIGAPVLAISCLLGVIKLFSVGISNINVVGLIFGFLSCLIASFLTIKLLLNFVKNHTLNVFAIYRIIVGIILLSYIFLNK